MLTSPDGSMPYSIHGFRRRVNERFESRADLLAATAGDHRLNADYEDMRPNGDFKPAAVLIAAFDRDGDAHVLLTQRAEHLNSHRGQIAFPGGKIDEGEEPIEAALREADEEVGLKAEDIDVLGAMGTYYSGSGYAITPVLAIIRGEPDLILSEDEVADAFEVPLSFLMDQNRHVVESLMYKEKERFFYVIPYEDDAVEPAKHRRIWGVTAGIIRTVQERLYGG